MKEKSKRLYYRFAEQVLRVLKIAHVRRFPHKNDPKKYGIWAHAVLLALKQLEDKSYRFIVELIAEMSSLLELLQIQIAPHWTTLPKAAQRLRETMIKRLVAAFVRSTKSNKVRTGIDATGLQLTRASVYYTKVISKDRKKRLKIKKHIKLSTVVDLDHQLPMSFKIRRGPASDHLDCNRLLRKAYRIKPLKSVDGDKGYTSEDHRKLVVEELGAEDRIKVKNPEVPIWRTKGEFLKKAKRRKLRANYRALNETYHSVLKKITGSTVRAITVRMQNIEVAFKILACAAYSKARILLTFRVFY